jgi:hypothetical protein
MQDQAGTRDVQQQDRFVDAQQCNRREMMQAQEARQRYISRHRSQLQVLWMCRFGTTVTSSHEQTLGTAGKCSHMSILLVANYQATDVCFKQPHTYMPHAK